MMTMFGNKITRPAPIKKPSHEIRSLLAEDKNGEVYSDGIAKIMNDTGLDAVNSAVLFLLKKISKMEEK